MFSVVVTEWNANYGEDERSIRRRNALANALRYNIPDSKRSLTSNIWTCLYSLAPASIWQFYCGQGQSGSKKISFADNLSIIYKSLIVAVIQGTRVDQKSVTSGISDVLKTMSNRKDAVQYRSSYRFIESQAVSSDDSQYTQRSVSVSDSEGSEGSTVIINNTPWCSQAFINIHDILMSPRMFWWLKVKLLIVRNS